MKEIGRLPKRFRADDWSSSLPESHTASEWSRKVAAFALLCEDFEPGSDLGVLVRRLAELLSNAPPPVMGLLGVPPRAALVEAQLKAEAFESAALSLVGTDIGYLLSRSPKGIAMASAWIPGTGEEHTVKAADPVSALCGALALACLSTVSAHPSLSRSPAN